MISGGTKRMALGFLVCLATVLFLGLDAVSAKTLDRVVATVDKEVITQSELDEAVDLFLHQMGKNQEHPITENERKALERRVLEELIDKCLLEAYAKESGIKASDEEINRAIDDVLSRANISRSQLEEALRRDGIPYAEYRDQIRDQIIKAKMIQQEIRTRIDIKEVDIEGYYLDHPEQFRTEEGVVLRHILIIIPKDSTKEESDRALEETLRIRKEILSGGITFEDAAKRYSQDSTAENGGWLGFFGKGAMSPEMEEAVWVLKDGEISQPIQSPMGIHLIKLDERTSGNVRGLDKVRESIREKLYEESAERQFEEWRKELRKNAHIEVLP